jgi:DNA-binding NarL/FixJ family response regulator
METRLLLTDDHEAFRRHLRELLETEPGMSVTGEAGDGLTALRLVDELNPDVVLMDVKMPTLGGIDVTRRIVSSHPAMKIIALSLHGDPAYVQAMLAAGASGYVLKDTAAEFLITAIAAVLAGQIYLSPGLETA